MYESWEKMGKLQVPFYCSHDSKQSGYVFTYLSKIYVDFVTLRETVYVLYIIIKGRLLFSPFWFPFWMEAFVWPCNWPPENLKSQSSLRWTNCSSTSWDSIKIFSETVHLRVISTPRIGNRKKHMLGQVVTVFILLSNILYDHDLITLIYWFCCSSVGKCLGWVITTKGL